MINAMKNKNWRIKKNNEFEKNGNFLIDLQLESLKICFSDWID